jgi:hypothetical protein
MTSLVDRYVFTALRRVPEKQRADIDRELRASIDDAVDARVDAGEPRAAAVESALLELGDPDRLADRYADRSDYLIGPELFPAWRRLLTLLLATVLPVVIGVTTVLQLLDGAGFGKIIGSAVGVLLNVGVHLAFWTTFVFLLMERTGAGRAELKTTWTLQDLPAYDLRKPGITTLAGYLIWSAVLIAALVLQQFAFTDQPVLDPAHWSFWWPYLIVMFALRAAWAVWIFRTGWTRVGTAANAILVLLTSGPLIWLLARDQFFNPAFTGWPTTSDIDVQHWVTTISIVVLTVVAVWDMVDVAVRAERSRRGLPTKVPGTGGSYHFG